MKCMYIFWIVASVLELVLAIAAGFSGNFEVARHCITLCFLFQILSNQCKGEGKNEK